MRTSLLLAPAVVLALAVTGATAVQAGNTSTNTSTNTSVNTSTNTSVNTSTNTSVNTSSHGTWWSHDVFHDARSWRYDDDGRDDARRRGDRRHRLR
jgi:hypothetical protein